MDDIRKVIESISDVHKARVYLTTNERRLESSAQLFMENVFKRIESLDAQEDVTDLRMELSSMIESLREISGGPRVNAFLGDLLTQLIRLERDYDGSDVLMRHYLTPGVVKKIHDKPKRILCLNTARSSTKLALFEGMEKVFQSEVHLPIDGEDTIETRTESVIGWLQANGLTLADIDGLAIRGGFPKPVGTGIYRVTPEMLRDMEQPRMEHPANKGVYIGMELVRKMPHPAEVLAITRDMPSSDEMELVNRLTGFLAMKRDGVGAHYLNHKAVWRLTADLMGIERDRLDMVTAHVGGGTSIALHRGGQVVDVFDAFGSVPSVSRAGWLHMPTLLDMITNKELNLKDLDAIIHHRGGLFSLAGTSDFRALTAFRRQGASEVQRKKIDTIMEFFARKIVASILRITNEAEPVKVLAVTGGLVGIDELYSRIEANLNGRFPLVRVPASLEFESLAAGWFQANYDPECIKDYTREVNRVAELRGKENQLLDTIIFEREIKFRRRNAPILTMDDLIDSAYLTVHDHREPTIAIIGANNEDAILAAKRANESGSYRLAKFRLLGDFAEINQIAYDFDLVIDDNNYAIVDTEDAPQTAVDMLDDGEVHILMKGSLHTDEILRTVFRYLKSSGKLVKGQVISHIFVLDIPTRKKPLLITDAAVNTYPDKDKRVQIIENALRVAKSLNIPQPKVAVMSAVETINKSVSSSVEAEEIAAHFAGRDDCIVEGPLSFDVAMDAHIAAEKKYKGKVGGSADILCMPDIDAGNMVYKTLTTQSGASCAGVILAGDMPLILTSRGDSAKSKLASISLAVKMYFEMMKSK